METYFIMNSNSAPASIIIPIKVDIAPCTTGANVCSNDMAILLFREPMAVKNPWKKEKYLNIINYKKLYRNTNLRNRIFSTELYITGTNILQLSYEKFKWYRSYKTFFSN